MIAAFASDISQLIAAWWAFLAQPIAETPWADWYGFWLARICDDRYLVSYCLPLLPVLLVFSRRHLRLGIILTGLVFLTYLFGVAYALLWLGMGLSFYAISERFAIETRRKDVIQWGPPLAAVAVVGGWFLVGMLLHKIQLPAALNAWLYEHAQWIFPLGVRQWSWEPCIFGPFHGLAPGVPAPLFQAVFWNPHNIGLAYFAIRMLHYFSELKRDTIPPEQRGPLKFLAYICYAPALMQGPIERYPRFQEEMDTCHQRRCWANLPPALARIGWGFFKALIANWYFLPLISGAAWKDYYLHPERIESYAYLYFGIYIQIFWLYLEFSGYCDISAGIARLLGYRQVENFNRPWLATSLRDFWRRWHISLSLMLRDYIYIPLGGNRRHVGLNLVLTFALIGVWHVLAFQMLAWGAVMGLMLAINQRWARWMKTIDAGATGPIFGFRRVFARLSPLPQILSWAVTMHFFVHSLLIFFGGSGAIRVTWELIRRPLAALLDS